MKKKICTALSICITIILMLLVANRILAKTTETDGKMQRIAWGVYEVTEDKENPEILKKVEGAYIPPAKADYKALDENYFVFCIERGVALPTLNKEKEIKEMAGLSAKDYLDAEVVAHAETEMSYDERKAAGDSVEGKRAIETRNGINKYNKQYYSRRLDASHATVNIKATENVDSSWTGGAINGKLDWDLAYILAQTKNSYNYEKNPAQLALWKALGYKDIEAGGDDIYKEALAFKDYREKHEEPSIDTQYENDFKYELVDSELIVGPICVDYEITHTYDGTELEVGEVIEDSCKLYGVDVDGKEILIDSSHYRFADANGNPMLEEYPAPGEETYIYIPYYDPMYTKIKYISRYEMSIKQLDVKASVYEITGANTVYRQWNPANIEYVDCSYRRIIGRDKYGPIYSYGSCTHLKGDCTAPYGAEVMSETTNYSRSYSILKKGIVITDGAQNLFILKAAELFWRKFDLVIEFGPRNETPPPTGSPTPTPTGSPPPLITYIDLGGIVWLDIPEDKETEPNGVFDEGHEKGMANVRVTLYFENGAKVTAGSGSKGNVPVRQDFENDIYTDENGKYEFKDLPMTEQYYVEFTYDGVTYEPTEAFAEGSLSGYLSDPNDPVYKKNSKAEEDEDERKEFNKKFEEIIGLGFDSLQNGITRGIAKGEGSEIEIQYNSFTKDNKIVSEYKRLEEYVEKKEAKEGTFKDLGMKAYTKQKSASTVVYPFDTNFTIWSVLNNINNKKDELGYLKYINLGLKERPKADFALNTQIKAGGMTIKDKEKVVFYKTNVKDEDLNIDGTQPTDEYIKQEIAATDYFWRRNAGKIGNDNIGYDIVKDDLNVYVLYKIVVQNQCEIDGMYGKITELVDYYDEKLELVPDDEKTRVSELFTENGLFEVPSGKTSWIDGTGEEVKWTQDGNKIGKYNVIKTTDFELVVKANENKKSTSAVYLILKVKENGDVLYTGDRERGEDPIENIAEISSYKVFNKDDQSAGTIDCDSAPKNATPGKKETYEDDTDAAPMFSLIINWTPKKISGNVWEDLDKNGRKDDNTSIKDVKVELIEYVLDEGGNVVNSINRPGLVIENNEVKVDKSDIVRTKSNGDYEFYVEGGNYSIKFIYGDTYMLYDEKNEHANKQYNGQDYQATKPYASLKENDYDDKKVLELEYQADKTGTIIGDGFATEKQGAVEKRLWGLTYETDKSNARDLPEIRAKLINSAMTLNYEKGNKLHELNVVNNIKSVSSSDIAETLSGKNNTEEINYTYMESVSDMIKMSANDLNEQNVVINLGLKERPKAGLKLEKEAVRTQLISNDGKVLIDTEDMRKLQNYAAWQDEAKEYATLTLEDKAMEGAVVKITYKLTVTNDGKIDNIDNYNYVDGDARIIKDAIFEKYKETFGNDATLDAQTTLPTRADFIYDYVNINLEFRQADNKVTDQDGKVTEGETKFAWKKVYDNRDANVDDKEIEGTISDKVLEQLPLTQKKVSKVIKTTDDANSYINLVPGATTSVYLDLSIALAENIAVKEGEDFVYSNSAEIVQTSTGAGRRDDRVVNGNNVPYADDPKEEPDFSETGRIIVIPPTGQQRYYYVLVAVGAIMMIGGVILIKKKVLGKNK